MLRCENRESIKAKNAGIDDFNQWWKIQYVPILSKRSHQDAIRLIAAKSMEDGPPIDKNLMSNTGLETRERISYLKNKAKFKSGNEIRTRLGRRIGIVISSQWDMKRNIFKYEIRFKNEDGYGNKEIEEAYDPEIEER